MSPPPIVEVGIIPLDRWKRRRRASTRASSSRLSIGLAMTSSAPASRKLIRSSTSSTWVRHITGIADRLGVSRISRQTSAGEVPAGVTSMITRLWSAAPAIAAATSVTVSTA